MFKFAIIRGLVHDQKKQPDYIIIIFSNANHGSSTRYHKANI